MKTIFVVLLLVSFFAGAGYYGLPIVVEKETRGLKSEVGNLKQRLEKAEEFIRNEEEAGKIGQLQPTADAQKIIKAVNALSSKVTSLENSFAKNIVSTDELIKKQTETVDKLKKETQAKLQKIMLDAAMANIRGHIAKARTDLLSKNITTAKTELDLIGTIFEALKSSAPIENRKNIEELEAILRNARADVETDLPAAISRVDLLWYEMSKLLRTSMGRSEIVPDIKAPGGG